jgi:hypothetical protein
MLNWDEKHQDSQDAESRAFPWSLVSHFIFWGKGFATAVVHKYIYLVKYKKGMVADACDPSYMVGGDRWIAVSN